MNRIVIEAKDEKGFVATQVFELELKGNSLEGTRAARNYFLGIGIDNYRLWPTLKNAKLDVKRFDTLLENKFGYDSSTVKFLFDEAATRDNIINGIRQFCKTPAIAVTGYGTDADAERCRKAGFDRHLAKPLNPEKLLEAIDLLVGRDGKDRPPAPAAD